MNSLQSVVQMKVLHVPTKRIRTINRILANTDIYSINDKLLSDKVENGYRCIELICGALNIEQIKQIQK